MSIVEPRTLSGFMELLPEQQILFNQIKEKIESTFKRFGFLPIDTPIIELSDVLLAKAGGETEKQIYRFNKGDNDLSLRFDLTVPFAKYVAKNYGNLSFPFRRYQIGKVYRGERVQRGRFREFYQCDIDIINDGKLSIINDAELPSIIYSVFKELGIEDFTICINNRKILNGFFEYLNQKEKSPDILRVIDKIEKIGKDAVIVELQKIGLDNIIIEQIIKFIEIDGTNKEKIKQIEELNIENELLKNGIQEMKETIRNISLFNIPDKYFKIDLTISRGLDYYTGTVYETFLDKHKEVGSLCSGGRYENLAKFYIDKKLEGVGMSIGLTRLFYVLNELSLIKPEEESITQVLIIPMVDDLDIPIKIANQLRENGTNTEIYLDEKKLKSKFKYADKLKIPYVIVIGEDEINSGSVKIRNMKTGIERKIKISEVGSERLEIRSEM